MANKYVFMCNIRNIKELCVKVIVLCNNIKKTAWEIRHEQKPVTKNTLIVLNILIDLHCKISNYNTEAFYA